SGSRATGCSRRCGDNPPLTRVAAPRTPHPTRLLHWRDLPFGTFLNPSRREGWPVAAYLQELKRLPREPPSPLEGEGRDEGCAEPAGSAQLRDNRVAHLAGRHLPAPGLHDIARSQPI